MSNNSVLALLRKRRSVRKFTNRQIEPQMVDILIEAAVRTPTSRGRNPWQFIVVNDALLLEQISRAKQHGSAFLVGTQLAIVVAADTTVSDVWIEDCSIAAMVLQLAAEELGLGSCWAQIRLRPHDTEMSAEQYLKELLELPASHAVECVIGFGYPDEQKEGHAFADLPFDQVHAGRYGKPIERA